MEKQLLSENTQPEQKRSQELYKLRQFRQRREVPAEPQLEGRSQSEVLEERLLAIEARLDKLEKTGRKQ